MRRIFSVVLATALMCSIMTVGANAAYTLEISRLGGTWSFSNDPIRKETVSIEHLVLDTYWTPEGYINNNRYELRDYTAYVLPAGTEITAISFGNGGGGAKSGFWVQEYDLDGRERGEMIVGESVADKIIIEDATLYNICTTYNPSWAADVDPFYIKGVASADSGQTATTMKAAAEPQKQSFFDDCTVTNVVSFMEDYDGMGLGWPVFCKAPVTITTTKDLGDIGATRMTQDSEGDYIEEELPLALNYVKYADSRHGDETYLKAGASYTLTEDGEYIVWFGGLCEELHDGGNGGGGSYGALYVTIEGGKATVSGFTDVASGAYYADAVKWAVERKITSGTTATTFSPNATCSNGQILTFLWRANEQQEPSIANPFSDVKSSDYYYKAALWALEKGLIAGTTLGADAPCTRSMVVTYLWKLAGQPEATKATSFTDVDSNADYAKAVAWAVEQGITSGTSATTFAPDGICTRGQIVTFLFRAMGK